MSTLLYIRHGQASYGHADYDQLSSMGYEQSRQLGRYLVTTQSNIDAIYVGPLKRHWQTYEMVKEVFESQGKLLPHPEIYAPLNEHRGPEVLKMNLPQLVISDPQIAEWEQQRQADPALWSKNGLLIFNKAMELWANGYFDKNHPPEYPKWSEFRNIVEQGLDQLLQKHQYDRGYNIALFTSGGTISATLGKILNIENHTSVIGLNGIVQNTSISEIIFNDKKATLKSFNAVPHLSNEMITYV